MVRGGSKPPFRSGLSRVEVQDFADEGASIKHSLTQLFAFTLFNSAVALGMQL
jgi:hypothetical protein